MRRRDLRAAHGGRLRLTGGHYCGPIGDGCGWLDQLLHLRGAQTCGGGGVSCLCGAPACVPGSCTPAAGARLRPVGDGCGGSSTAATARAGQTCGGAGSPTSAACSPPCTNLCLKQLTCPGGGTTSVSGTVFAPTPPARFGTPDPLYNALVYVPNGTVHPFTPGVSCDQCGADLPARRW